MMNSSPAVTCGKTRFTALDLVLQSFGNVAAYYYTIWEAIGSIESRIQSSCITISSTFAVHDTGLSALDVFKTIVEMLQLIPQLGGGGLWGRVRISNSQTLYSLLADIKRVNVA